MELKIGPEQKNTIINVAILLIAGFIALKMYQGQQAQITQLLATKEAEQNKSETVTSIDALTGKMKEIKKLVNDKDIGDVFNAINTLARQSGVNIVSLKPTPENSEPLFLEYEYQLAATAPSYSAIGGFVSALENHQFIFTVSSMTMSKSLADSGEKDSFTLDMKVSTLMLK